MNKEAEIIINEESQEVILKIPIVIPKSLYEAGAIDIHASKFANWTPTIKQTVEEEVEIPATDDMEARTEVVKKEVEIPNPISGLNAGVSRIQEKVKEEYRSIVIEKGAEQGRKQALESFEQLFNE